MSNSIRKADGDRLVRKTHLSVNRWNWFDSTHQRTKYFTNFRNCLWKTVSKFKKKKTIIKVSRPRSQEWIIHFLKNTKVKIDGKHTLERILFWNIWMPTRLEPNKCIIWNDKHNQNPIFVNYLLKYLIFFKWQLFNTLYTIVILGPLQGYAFCQKVTIIRQLHKITEHLFIHCYWSSIQLHISIKFIDF